MATRKPSPRIRALRPTAEDLESRQLLAAMVSGTDADGDTWTLRLMGPGSLTVVKQNGPDGTPAPLNSQTEINSITVAGTNPLESRLVGTVKKGPKGDGKVFFNTFIELENRSEHLSGVGLGLLGINMPSFWLGNTFPSSATTPTIPHMTIPDGVGTLNFGGVDTTHNQVNPPPSSATSNHYDVGLGLPAYGGTHIIINKSISSTQSVPSTSGGTPTIIQHGVDFAVLGRVDLFQANEIDGDALNPPGQFNDQVSTASGIGGTNLFSTTNGSTPLAVLASDLVAIAPNTLGAVTGAIGNVRVGGNATNFSTVVEDLTGVSGAKINNFSVGGETNNVLVVAPNGMHNAAFGAGMDTTDIVSNVLNTLEANRGAINSNVYIDRTISRAHFGGDVINSNILTGLSQNFNTILNNVLGVPANALASPSPTAPPFPESAQIGGGMTALVGGNVTNSVFAASVQPFNSAAPGSAFSPVYGDPHDIVLPTGQIAAKVTGTIDNSTATQVSANTPSTAFFANQVHLNHGPVIPPNVPQPPYPVKLPIHAPGLHNTPLQIKKLRGLQTTYTPKRLFTGGVPTPRGPLKNIVQ
jgi:hypothetical protein